MVVEHHIQSCKENRKTGSEGMDNSKERDVDILVEDLGRQQEFLDQLALAAEKTERLRGADRHLRDFVVEQQPILSILRD